MTIIKRVTGLYYNDVTGEKDLKKLTVRMTQDHKGKTLSIADDQRKIMLQIPLEPILKELRKGRTK